MALNTKTFREVITRRFRGRLSVGLHTPNSRACALEAYSQALGVAWTDDPKVLHIPDLRPLNDARWSSDTARTDAMIPLVVALAGWKTWSTKRRDRWLRTVVIETVRQIIAALPNLPTVVARRCRSVTTLRVAVAMARVARELGVVGAVEAAEEEKAWDLDWAAAKWAAEVAERAVERGDKVLTQACRIWIKA